MTNLKPRHNSAINTALVLEVILRDKLAQFESGEIRWSVANQHTPTVYESALDNLTPETLEEVVSSFHPDAPIESTYHELAHRLSTFKPSGIDSAWTD